MNRMADRITDEQVVYDPQNAVDMTQAELAQEKELAFSDYRARHYKDKDHAYLSDHICELSPQSAKALADFIEELAMGGKPHFMIALTALSEAASHIETSVEEYAQEVNR